MNEGDFPPELPKRWVWATLADIADSTLGKMLDRKKGGEHPVPYLRNVNVQWGCIDTDNVLTMSIPPEQQELFRVRDGDLLVCEGGEIGRCAVFRGEDAPYIAFQKALHRVRPLGGVSSHYLRYYMEYLHVTGGFSKFTTGSTIKHLTQQQLKRLPVRVPPVQEQRRIVSTLDEQLSRIFMGSSLLEKAERRLSNLKLNLANTKTSPAGGLDGQAVWVNFGDIVESTRGGWSRSRSHLVSADQGTPYLKMNNISPSGELHLREIVCVSTDEKSIAKYSLREGDVLFNNKNSRELVGKTALVDQRISGWVFNENISRIRLVGDALPEFAVLQMNSSTFRKEISKMRSASTNVAAIYTRDLKRAPFWLPPLREQRKLVDEYKRISSMVDKLHLAISSSSTRGQALRRSLLSEAFAGRLVPQDPADEPADALLTRIRVEREAAGATKPRRSTARRGPAQREPDAARAADAPPLPLADAPAVISATQPTLDLEIPS